jgi:hypothetical protein
LYIGFITLFYNYLKLTTLPDPGFGLIQKEVQ